MSRFTFGHDPTLLNALISKKVERPGRASNAQNGYTSRSITEEVRYASSKTERNLLVTSLVGPLRLISQHVDLGLPEKGQVNGLRS